MFRYVASDSEWLEDLKLVPSDGAGETDFGASVALDGNVIFVGAHLDDEEDTWSGSTYIYGVSTTNEFLRGDVNGDGIVTALTDALRLLDWSFVEGLVPPCMDAADVDDSGEVFALIDALVLLTWSFTDGAVPPSPGPDLCGIDPTTDTVDCLEGATCP